VRGLRDLACSLRRPHLGPHAGGVGLRILPIGNAGCTYLVGQHRYGADCYSCEVPAEGGEPDEDPLKPRGESSRRRRGLAADHWLELSMASPSAPVYPGQAHESRRRPFSASVFLMVAMACPPVAWERKRSSSRSPVGSISSNGTGARFARSCKRPLSSAARRTFQGRPPRCSPVLTDPEKILRRMGMEAQVEPQPGGIYLVNVTGARFARGSFREVVPVHRLAYSFGWDDSEVVPPGVKPGRD
jgi:hypothetical protein